MSDDDMAEARLRRRFPVDPYKVFALPPTATSDEIKKRFRILARLLHPDKLVGLQDQDRWKSRTAEAAFKDVVAANTILTDAHLKKEYDRWISRTGSLLHKHQSVDFIVTLGLSLEDPSKTPQKNTTRPLAPSGETLSNRCADTKSSASRDRSSQQPLKPIPSLSSIHPQSRKKQSLSRGSSHEVPVRLRPPLPISATLESLANSSVKRLIVTRKVFPATRTTKTATTKPPSNPSEQVLQRHTVLVPLHPGMKDGHIIDLPGAGDETSIGVFEPLKLVLAVRPHRLFSRSGMDLTCTVTVPKEILRILQKNRRSGGGGRSGRTNSISRLVTVEGIRGNLIDLTDRIVSGGAAISDGMSLVIPGQGMPAVTCGKAEILSPPGDLIVTIRIADDSVTKSKSSGSFFLIPYFIPSLS